MMNIELYIEGLSLVREQEEFKVLEILLRTRSKYDMISYNKSLTLTLVHGITG
jgi:hypothetical protein